jgi:hypothetical protein
MTSAGNAEYPVRLEVSDAFPQSRLTVFFRLLLLIPHFIIIWLLAIVATVIYVISWFAILFTGKYPAGMLNFMIGFFRWTARTTGYSLLLTDRYPPFSLAADEGYAIRLYVDERIEGRNRLTTFWPVRFILAIPHLIILAVLQYAVAVVVFIAWIIALFTASVPGGLHNFLAGYLRWYERVYAYLFLLVDEYPPFSLG